MKWEEYFKKLSDIWIECYRILKPGGRIIVNIQPLFSDYIPTHHIISNQLQDIGFLWKAEILWEKIIIMLNIQHGVAGNHHQCHI